MLKQIGKTNEDQEISDLEEWFEVGRICGGQRRRATLMGQGNVLYEQTTIRHCKRGTYRTMELLIGYNVFDVTFTI